MAVVGIGIQLARDEIVDSRGDIDIVVGVSAACCKCDGGIE